MKPAICCFFLVLTCLFLTAQTVSKTQHIFIITTDGFRWQELFTGADPDLIGNPKFVRDTALLRQLYWDEEVEKRRAMLMPFFWNVIAAKGQLYGNRLYENKVNVSNFYKVSYPGYNEIFTGYADPGIVLNLPRNNRNVNILEFLNAKKEYQGKVVAFSSWNVFPFILNEERNQLPMNSGYESMTGEDSDSTFQLINKVQENVSHKTHCRHDLLTFLNAQEYIEEHHPSVVFIGFGETDEFAHAHHYDLYLKQAATIDKMISDLWYYVQTDPFYKDNTTFIITTDHGRGNRSFNWSNHSLLTPGSAQTWLAVLGPEVEPLGEIKTNQQLYQKQLAATITRLLGEPFESTHRIGRAISFVAMPMNGIADSHQMGGK
jgi:Type I phosphodiesterase / nucleotide pyrophosphatase